MLGYGVPVGLGSHVHWDRKLDGLLAQALMSIQAVKGVEIGDGFDVAGRRGSEAHDAIAWDADAGAYRRETTRAGGIEGGMTTGELLVARVAMKPLATLNRPTLGTVDTATKEETVSFKERTDVTAVPAMGVVAETMVALVLADEVLRKFGGDSIGELVRNHRRLPAAGRARPRPGSRRAAADADDDAPLNWDESQAFDADQTGDAPARRPAARRERPQVTRARRARRHDGRRARRRSAGCWPSALGRPFVDSDEMVEARTGRTVAEIFEADGEAGFRAEEPPCWPTALADADAVGDRRRRRRRCSTRPTGACIRQAAADGGLVVWLRADAAVLARAGRDRRPTGRCSATTRPRTLARLAAVREPLYPRSPTSCSTSDAATDARRRPASSAERHRPPVLDRRGAS